MCVAIVDHVLSPFVPGQLIRLVPCSPDSVATGFWSIFKSEDDLATTTFDTFSCQNAISRQSLAIAYDTRLGVSFKIVGHILSQPDINPSRQCMSIHSFVDFCSMAVDPPSVFRLFVPNLSRNEVSLPGMEIQTLASMYNWLKRFNHSFPPFKDSARIGREADDITQWLQIVHFLQQDHVVALSIALDRSTQACEASTHDNDMNTRGLKPLEIAHISKELLMRFLSDVY